MTLRQWLSFFVLDVIGVSLVRAGLRSALRARSSVNGEASNHGVYRALLGVEFDRLPFEVAEGASTFPGVVLCRADVLSLLGRLRATARTCFY